MIDSNMYIITVQNLNAQYGYIVCLFLCSMSEDSTKE